MKTILCLLALSSFTASAQWSITHQRGGANILNLTDFTAPPPAPVVADPWRLINGRVEKVDGSWVAIAGVVAQVHPKEGIRMKGVIEGVQQDNDFFLVNFPYPVAEADGLPAGYVFLFKPAGVYSYDTALKSTRTIRKYDYGVPCDAPVKSAAEIEAERKLAAKKKLENSATSLKFNQTLAEQGDAYGQLRMGERYRDGDGVETNLLRARVLFMQSADQGNAAAAKALAAMTNSTAK